MHVLRVEGMSCGHCIKAVTDSVQQIDHDAKVQVDLAEKTVQVESMATLDAIIAAIIEAGYIVKI